MGCWRDLRAILTDLRGSEPRPLQSFPDPDGDDDRQPPFAITLAPWATAVAQDLHDRFGSDVSLGVGLLAFPERRPRGGRIDAPVAYPDLDPGELAVELDGPLAIASGHTARHGLRVTNLAAWPIDLRTNGQLTAHVVDPRTGTVTGGFGGWQTMPLIRFRIEARQTVTVPLLVATASFDPELGYAVPPGDWAVVAPLPLEDGRTVRTPRLPITVI